MSLALADPRRARVKAADPNDGSDRPFEQSFSNLAMAYLEDRAPTLLDFLIGFQLVDRNDDNTKAVGVAGFKVGSQWLYAPVFFINGDLKGHELLYLKGEDQFVPLDEGWVNDILAKKPATLGEGVGRDTRDIGVHYPDLVTALRGPYKSASAVAWAPGERAALAAEAAPLRAKLAAVPGFRPATKDWAVAGVAALLKRAATPIGLAPRLLDLLADGGLPAVRDLDRAFAAYPTLKVAFERFYPRDAVKAALARAAARPGGPPRPARPRKQAGSVLDAVRADTRRKVEVVRHGGLGKSASVLLDDADKEALLARGVLVKDARDDDEVTRAYAVPARVEVARTLTTPHDTGIYDVLTRDGSLERCVVFLGPVSAAARRPWATVVKLEGRRKGWLNIHPSFVYAAAQLKGWPEWYEGLPEAEGLSAGDGPYIAIGPDGTATAPFVVVRDLGADAVGGEAYEVRFDDYCERREPPGLCPSVLDPGGPCGYDTHRDGARVHLGAARFRAVTTHGGDVYMPEGSRLLKLAPDGGEDAEGRVEADGARACGPWQLGRSLEPAVSPGDALDVEASIYRKFAALALAHDGRDVAVGDRAFAGEDAAIEHLVSGLGFREAAARALLKEAAAHRGAMGHPGAAYTVLVKYADPYAPGGRTAPFLTAGGPTAPAPADAVQATGDPMGGGLAAAQYPYEESLAVPDLRGAPPSRDAYEPAAPDPTAAQVASDAARRGQKDVFDVSMIGGLLRATRDDQLVDKYQKSLMEALNSLGRMQLSLYWHGERFAERFGDSEMPELEDSIRNTFENLGELTLFLRRRSVTASPAEASQSIDLGEIADQ